MLCLTSFGQSDISDQEIKKAPLQGFSVSGNYRFFGQHRIFVDPYLSRNAINELETYDGRSILIGDATQLPELTLNISGSPAPGTSFGTDLVVWNQFTGERDPSSTANSFTYYNGLQLGVNLYGSFSTEVANFNVRTGGIHWYSMTPFTMKAFAGYNRYSLFQRNPWDPQLKDIDGRYSEYYDRGAITQDGRWANQAFQGTIVDISDLPYGLSASLIYGSTQTAAASLDPAAQSVDTNYTSKNSFIRFLNTTVPNYVYGGRVIKKIGKHSVSLNSFNQRSYLDIMATEPIDNHIATTEFLLPFKKVTLSGEFGIGKYMDLDMGEMATLKAMFSEKLTKIPLEIHLFRINKNVVNLNSEFVNTSVRTASPINDQTTANGFAPVTILQPTGSSMLGLGQMANNRQGININGDIKVKDLTLTIGNGISKEIENINNNVSFGHMVNGVSFSEIWRWQNWPGGVGPYGRKSNLFRGMYETVILTDLSDEGEVVNDKFFNTVETQLKYKFKLFNRDWYWFYLGSYSSVQTKFSPITVLNEDAYVRVYAHQLESYYAIHKKLVLASYLGWQRNIANYSTLVDLETQRPLNQRNWAVGGGIDYMMAKNTGLYLRHRWFTFEDTSFELDNFKAHESTVELKVYF